MFFTSFCSALPRLKPKDEPRMVGEHSPGTQSEFNKEYTVLVEFPLQTSGLDDNWH